APRFPEPAVVAGDEKEKAMNREPHPVGIDRMVRGETAEEALLQRWEPLARYLARRFVGAREREDLEQVARLGLLRAARRFDPALGWQFSTFAAATILGDLRRYLRDRGPVIRCPRRWWELRPRLEEARERLAQGLGREPTCSELADRLAVSEEDIAG